MNIQGQNTLSQPGDCLAAREALQLSTIAERMGYTYPMKHELIQKQLNRTSTETYWLGAVIGLAAGIGLSIMIESGC
jgi:hypothetical protein